MIKDSEIIQAGKFYKPHGLKGELNILTDYDSGILEEGYPIIVEIDGIYVPFYAESVRPKGHYSSLVKLEGIDSEEDARQFVNREFSLLKKDVSEYLDIPEDELLTGEDFVGYKVFDTRRGYVGRVEYLDTSTDNMLLHVVRDGSDDDEGDVIYIPLDDDLIDHVVEGEDEPGELRLNLPDGLLELND